MPETKPDPRQTADKIRALRLFLHRIIDRMYDELTSPTCTGTMRLELSAKAGRPGEPRHGIERYGVTE